MSDRNKERVLETHTYTNFRLKPRTLLQSLTSRELKTKRSNCVLALQCSSKTKLKVVKKLLKFEKKIIKEAEEEEDGF